MTPDCSCQTGDMATTRPPLWKKLLGAAFLVGVIAIVVPLYFQRIEHYASMGDEVGVGVLSAAIVVAFVAFVALPVGIYAAVRSSAQRERLLAARFPSAITFEVMFWKSIFQPVPAAPLSIQDELAAYGTKITVVASGSGITFWTGRGEPSQVAEIQWSEVSDVRTGGGSTSFTTHRPSIIILTRNAGAISGGVRRERGWSVLQEPELEELAKSLRAIGKLSEQPAT